MKLIPKISPLVWWLIIILSTSLGSAAIAIAYDSVGDGLLDIESEFALGRTRITGDGPIAASQAFNVATDIYNSTSLVDADRGSVRTKTGNTDTRVRADNLTAKISLGYNFVHAAGEPEVIEDREGNLFIHTENQSRHYESDVFQVAGNNGSLDQEFIMSIAGKKRKVFDGHMAGNLSHNLTFKASGIELIESWESLPDQDTISESEAERMQQETYGRVLK